jgi:hypothetical protein
MKLDNFTLLIAILGEICLEENCANIRINKLHDAAWEGYDSSTRFPYTPGSCCHLVGYANV